MDKELKNLNSHSKKRIIPELVQLKLVCNELCKRKGNKNYLHLKGVKWKEQVKIAKDENNITIGIEEQGNLLAWHISNEKKQYCNGTAMFLDNVEIQSRFEFSSFGKIIQLMPETKGIQSVLQCNDFDNVFMVKFDEGAGDEVFKSLEVLLNGWGAFINAPLKYRGILTFEELIVECAEPKPHFTSSIIEASKLPESHQIKINIWIYDANVIKAQITNVICEYVESIQSGTPSNNYEDTGLSIQERIVLELKKQINNLLKIPVNKIQIDASLQSYGFTSLSLIEFAGIIGEIYGIEITADIFFSYPTVEMIATYIITNYREAIMDYYDNGLINDSKDGKNVLPSVVYEKKVEKDETNASGEDNKKVSIIGISGRFPEARSVAELWNIVLNGKEVIQDVSRHGWDGSKKRRMGVLPGVGEFDPKFFEITPLEAEKMDPRQRLLLEEAWKALEDAGYNSYNHDKDKVGIFVGAEESDYRATVSNDRMITANSTAILAARMAYYMNFRGPNMCINTACSSGLVALHEAVLSLNTGECDVAIVAGVNLLTSSDSYDGMDRASMLSPDGHCYAFDKRANGMVPAEAIAVLVLMSEERAKHFGYHIYANVVGSGVNYDGKTNGITAPNGVAQVELLEDIYKRYNIDTNDIDYIVTHGTGTKLGDPIEVNSLFEVYKKGMKEKQYCALTSIKPNIGHSQAASGLVNLIILSLSMKNAIIPPTINCEEPNDYIQWDDSPFYLNREPKKWNVKKNRNRKGAVSSFGFGGTNAHVVLESKDEVETTNSKAPAYLLLFSANSKKALNHKLEDMLVYFNKNSEDIDLMSVSYTLLKGRKHMKYRCAMVITNVQEALELLDLAKSEENVTNICYGEVDNKFKEKPAVKESISNIIENSRKIAGDRNRIRDSLRALAEFYCFGYDRTLSETFMNSEGSYISLPTYPFDENFYWENDQEDKTEKKMLSSHAISPLLHENISKINHQCFHSKFSGRETFFKDHIVQGKAVLPGAAYLEMAYQAASHSGCNDKNIVLRNIIWSSPIELDSENIDVYIDIVPQKDKYLDFIVLSLDKNETSREHCRGCIDYSSVKSSKLFDIDKSMVDTSKVINKNEFYAYYDEMGISYGCSHRVVEEVYKVSEDTILAKIKLPNDIEDGYYLHPSMIDGGFQTTIALFMDQQNHNRCYLPFAIDDFYCYENTHREMLVIVHRDVNSRQKKFNIEFYSMEGKLCVEVIGFTSREVQDGFEGNRPVEIYKCKEWIESKIFRDSSIKNNTSDRLVFCCGFGEELCENDFRTLNNIRFFTSDKVTIDKKYKDYVGYIFDNLQSILQSKPQSSFLLQIVVPNQNEYGILSGLIGMLRSAKQENPLLDIQLIMTDDTEKIEEYIEKEKDQRDDTCICYSGTRRLVEQWKEFSPKSEKDLWKANGVYLIFGGSGGLGNILTKEILDKEGTCKVILIGRQPLNNAMRSKLRKLDRSGENVAYFQTDVCEKDSVEKLVEHIINIYGKIDGIIQCAGIIKDNYILKKDPSEVEAVLTPKVTGTVIIDEATKNLNIDFFICFSSIAGALGNIGQSDYGAANGFLDGYMKYRNMLVNIGERKGKSISINWPLWENGGMQIDKATLEIMEGRTGLKTLPTDIGIKAFYNSVLSGEEQVMFMYSNKEFKKDDDNKERGVDLSSNKYENIRADIGTLKEKMNVYLEELMANTLKIPKDWIEPDATFEQYGIDSINVMLLTDELEKIFGTLSKTLFFEYQTIEELSDYFVSSFQEKIVEFFNLDFDMKGDEQDEKTHCDESLTPLAKSEKEETSSFSLKETDEIAIIGVAGYYPNAHDIKDFWNNLCEGKDCVTEIPKTRWDIAEYNKDNSPKYCSYGGFISSIKEFDPIFFNISPKEAEIMEPQERLFLQCAYSAIEDAGYTRKSLAGKDGDVGVFVGAMYEEYQLYCAQMQAQGRNVTVGGSISSIANRVSYCFDFHGPSISVDTMCSSSLTSIHMACTSLHNGECEVAIAGGTNISIHPNKYLLLAANGFSSSKGKCESFGEGGDGYVPGEGIGAVILKPLHKAIADKDNIYAIIKGSAINHGGKTNGYTVPSPIAQREVINKVYEKANINPRSITYIEAHGTGTKLGDPIEINGLTQAFKKYTDDKQFCSIGSVKSNIGHCESAAGIASITKVLLQMRFGLLVPSLHTEMLNPYIDFDNSPFKVQRTLENWAVPKVFEKEAGGGKRRAGISSFGAGGANAHLLLEEYVYPNKESEVENEEQIILLSAKSKEQLIQKVKDLLNAISDDFYSHDLLSIAYTLMVGREAMDYRIAFIVNNINDLQEKLTKYLSNNVIESERFFQGQINKKDNMINEWNKDEDIRKLVSTWIEKKKWKKILSLWVNGFPIEWERVCDQYDRYVHRISLPTYPFAKEEYWISSDSIKTTENEKRTKDTFEKNASTETVEQSFKRIVNEILGIPIDKIDMDETYQNLGFNSISLVELAGRISERYDFEVLPDVFFSYPTLNKLIEFFRGEKEFTEKSTCDEQPIENDHIDNRHKEDNAISIIGMSGRFPDARNIEDLWKIILEKKEVISNFPKDRIKVNETKVQSKFRKIGMIPGIEEFDPEFFEISPREATIMDPRQRLLMQEAWRALEDAGCNDDYIKNHRISLYVGAEEGDYGYIVNKESSITSSSNSILASRLAYFLDLHGANIAINTACSSGLVALHQAVMALANDECDTSIVAGVNLLTTPINYDAMDAAGMLSNDGHCYAFDKRAKGMVPGEAIAVVVLKRFGDAVNEGRRIYANIVASGVNYDGKTNGITAPSGRAQQSLLNEVYTRYNISPRSIEYVVTHGTGTRLGDPIEINALSKIYSKASEDRRWCALTSIKPNIGHCQAASGLISLIILAMAMRKETIPPSINCEQKSEYIKWEDSPFYLNESPRAWKTTFDKMRGAVSAFGYSGTNAHVVLESYKSEEDELKEARGKKRASAYIIPVSGKTEEAVYNNIKSLLKFTEKVDDIDSILPSISYTLLEGRTHFSYRYAIVAVNGSDLKIALRKILNQEKADNIYFGKKANGFNEKTTTRKADQEQMDIFENGHEINNAMYMTELNALAKKYSAGYTIPFMRFGRDVPYLMTLPGYNFARKKFWFSDDYVRKLERSRKPERTLPEKRVERIDSTIENNEPEDCTSITKLNLVKRRNEIMQSQTKYKQGKLVLTPLDSSYQSDNNEVLETVHKEKNQKFTLTNLILWMKHSLAGELFVAEESIELDKSFIEMGVDSIIGVEWIRKINKKYNLGISSTQIYQYPSIRTFAEYLLRELGEMEKEEFANEDTALKNESTMHSSVGLAQEITKFLTESLASELFIELDEVDINKSFMEMGLDSVLGVEWINKINKRYGLNLSSTMIYQYPNVVQFTKYLQSVLGKEENETIEALLEKVYKGDIDVLEAQRLLSNK